MMNPVPFTSEELRSLNLTRSHSINSALLICEYKNAWMRCVEYWGGLLPWEDLTSLHRTWSPREQCKPNETCKNKNLRYINPCKTNEDKRKPRKVGRNLKEAKKDNAKPKKGPEDQAKTRTMKSSRTTDVKKEENQDKVGTAGNHGKPRAKKNDQSADTRGVLDWPISSQIDTQIEI